MSTSSTSLKRDRTPFSLQVLEFAGARERFLVSRGLHALPAQDLAREELKLDSKKINWLPP
jgi:hypothetical protein